MSFGTIKASNLIPCGEDFWSRPMFYHAERKLYFCTVEFDMTLDDVLAGRCELYYKGPDEDGEPVSPVEVTP